MWADQVSMQISRAGAIRLSRNRAPSRSALRHSYIAFIEANCFTLIYLSTNFLYKKQWTKSFFYLKNNGAGSEANEPTPTAIFYVFFIIIGLYNEPCLSRRGTCTEELSQQFWPGSQATVPETTSPPGRIKARVRCNFILVF